MVSFEKMRIMAFVVRWGWWMIPLSVNIMAYARSEVRGVCQGNTFTEVPIFSISDFDCL